MDGVSLLWAARNFTHAEKATKRFFDSRVPEGNEYRLEVEESGSSDVIFETSSLPDSPDSVSSISRLVSGHRIDKPSEGFQARARATSVTKNETKIVSLPAMGNAHENGKMEVKKNFTLDNPDKIFNGTFYINVEYNSGQSVEQLRINDQQKKNDIQNLFDNGDTFYGKVDVTEELQSGENSIYIRLKGEANQDQPNEFQPGSFLEIKYRKDDYSDTFEKTRHEKIYMEDIYSRTPGSGEPGIFKVESFDIPRDAEFINASMHLNAKHLTGSNCGGFFEPSWNVRIYFNEDVIRESCEDGTFTYDYEVPEDKVKDGTNIFAIYLEHLGEYFWGGQETRLYSDFSTDSSSHVDVWYNVSDDDLRFGEIKVTASEAMGGGIEEPKVYRKEFDYKDLQDTEVYIAQKYSNTVHLEVDDGNGYQEVFQSPEVRATPTMLKASPEYYDVDEENRIKMYDSGPDLIEFYPESTFQWTVWAPSQVGYGQLYPTRSEAVNDAENRLEDKLGPFVDATGIETEQVSTGDQPYIWGPASVKLVVWRE